MPRLEYDRSMSVGIPEIDEQHREWISLVNYLNDSIHDGRANEALRTTLNETLAYTVQHFMTEERLMRRYKYPYLDVHTKEHAMFIDRVHGYVDAYIKGVPVLAMDVAEFMKKWIWNHTTTTDQGYAKYIADVRMVEMSKKPSS